MLTMLSVLVYLFGFSSINLLLSHEKYYAYPVSQAYAHARFRVSGYHTRETSSRSFGRLIKILKLIN